MADQKTVNSLEIGLLGGPKDVSSNLDTFKHLEAYSE